jgi:hypothetical protein
MKEGFYLPVPAVGGVSSVSSRHMHSRACISTLTQEKKSELVTNNNISVPGAELNNVAYKWNLMISSQYRSVNHNMQLRPPKQHLIANISKYQPVQFVRPALLIEIIKAASNIPLHLSAICVYKCKKTPRQ